MKTELQPLCDNIEKLCDKEKNTYFSKIYSKKTADEEWRMLRI
jgi:hypothetical protein